MKVIDGILYLDWNELRSYGYSEKYLSKVTTNYRKGSKTYANIPDPDDNRKNLVRYDSIPRDSIEYKNIPGADQLIRECQRQKLELLIKPDSKAFDLYYSSPAAEHATDLQEVASWLMLAAPVSRSQVRQLGYVSLNDLYQDIMDLLNDKVRRHELNAWNTRNLRRFKDKIKPFYQYYKSHPSHFNPSDPDYYYTQTSLHPVYKSALETLISKKYGVRNAAKLKERDTHDTQAEEQQALLIRLYSDPMKLSLEQTWIAYIRKATDMHNLWKETKGTQGWDDRCLFTRQTAENFLYRADIRQIWYSRRHGSKPAQDAFMMVTKRKPASRANGKWVIDGTPIHMYFMRNGKAWNRLNVFFVMDEYSWAILGYCISFNENSEQVIAALRDACRRTGQLPYEIQSDNSKPIQAWHTQHAIRTISKHYTPASPGNARSKRIEPFLKHFNDRILKLKPGYMGNPHATLNHQPNMEVMLEKVKNKLIPTFEQAYKILDESLNEWNSHIFDGAQPLVKYHHSVQQHQSDQRLFSPAIDVHAFWYQPGRMVQVPDTSGSSRKMVSVFQPTEYTYSNRGIVVEHKDQVTGISEKYHFDVPDAAFNASHISSRFTIRIEPEKFDRAMLYQDGKPLIHEGRQVIAERAYEQPSARIDAGPEDMNRLHKTLQVKKGQEEMAAAKFDRYIQVAGANGHAEPIESSWIHGKEISGPAAAALNESLVNKRLASTGQPEPEPVPVEETIHETIKRF